jgi:hypothetical protein
MGKGKVVFSVRAGRKENGRIRTKFRCHLPPVVRAAGGSIYCTSSALSNTGRSYPHHW